MKHFNKLSPTERERLVILIEECSEVIEISYKILRHGYDLYNPRDRHRTPNRYLLEEGIGHVQAAVRKMTNRNDVRSAVIQEHANDKFHNVNKYTHHQENENES